MRSPAAPPSAILPPPSSIASALPAGPRPSVAAGGAGDAVTAVAGRPARSSRLRPPPLTRAPPRPDRVAVAAGGHAGAGAAAATGVEPRPAEAGFPLNRGYTPPTCWRSLARWPRDG